MYSWCAHLVGLCYLHLVYALLNLQILLTGNMIDKMELNFLLRYPIVLNVSSPVDFLSNNSWGGIKALANMDQFRNLDKDIEV